MHKANCLQSIEHIATWELFSSNMSLSLKTLNAFRSVAKQSYNVQATSKSSDQTACMRKLV